MARAGVLTHNPFEFAKGRPDSHIKPEAKFEIRARIRTQLDAIDEDIRTAMRRHDLDRIEELTVRRNRLLEELP